MVVAAEGVTLDADGTLEVPLLPAQIRVLSYDTEWAAVRGGKGAGKTVGLAFWMLRRLETYPLAAHYVVGADYEQLRRGFFESFCDAVASIGWERGVDFRYRESPSPMIILPSGARLKALSAELALRINSVEFQTLLLEEPQTWLNGSEKAFDVYGVLESRRRHSLRSAAEYGTSMPLQGRMSFNPPRVGTWLHTLITETWPRYGWPCDRVTVRDNYLLLDQAAYIRRLEAAFPPSAWSTEIDGHWSTATGGAHREFVRDVHCDPPASVMRGLDPNLPLLWTLDFNVARMRSSIAQIQTQNRIDDGITYITNKPPQPRYRLELPGWQHRIIRFVGEIALDEGGSRAVVRAFIERYGAHARRTGVVLYGDATGGNRSQVDGETSNWSTIREELGKVGIRYTSAVPSRNGPPLDRILTLDASFRSGEGFGATIDAEACPELLADIEQCIWAKNGTDYDKSDPRRTHSSDGAGYLAVGIHRAIREQAARVALPEPTTIIGR